MSLIFFTDPNGIENKYAMIQLKDFGKYDIRKYKIIFWEPGVYQLKKSDSYNWESWMNIGEFLDALPDWQYFSADYPCDMNIKYTDTFLKKSWNNAIKYCYYPQYIVTVQSEFMNLKSFKKWFDKYNSLEIASGVLGIGNLCRLIRNSKEHKFFIEKLLNYAFRNTRYKRIHIYGLSKWHMKMAYDLAKRFKINLSIDSTKWTRPVSKELKEIYGKRSCNSENRQIYFNEYIKKIKQSNIKIKF